MDATDVLAVLGLGLLLAGIAILSIPAALIVAGLVLVAAARTAGSTNG